MDCAYSVSSGIWVATGSRDEEERLAGVSHFLEHMMFKGTPQRSARQIAEELENFGGQLNAFTSKQHTCFYAKILGEYFPLSFDVLADIVRHSLFAEEEFERERKVILEEIKMYEDTPDDLVHDLFMRTLWAGEPLGRPVIGTAESVSALARDEMVDYYRRRYVPENMVVAVAGRVKRAEVLEMAERYFGDFGGVALPAAEQLPQARQAFSYLHKDIAQSHICLGFPALPAGDPDLYPLLVMDNILGGGSSSHLFQKAREERGLCYSIFSYQMAYRNAGAMAVYASTGPERLDELMEVVCGELKTLREKGFGKEEIEKNKQQLKCSILMGMESSASVMRRLGKTMLEEGRVVTAEEAVEKIMAVTEEDVHRLVERIIRPERLSMALVAPEERQFEVDRLLL